jgi:hypothetical protein
MSIAPDFTRIDIGNRTLAGRNGTVETLEHSASLETQQVLHRFEMQHVLLGKTSS